MACLGYVLLDGLVTSAGLHLVGSLHMNWIGKTFSIGLAVVVILMFRPTRGELPLGLPADRSSWGWTILGIVAVCAFSGIINFILRDHAFPSGEKIAFEAAMPGLAEELCWRGVVFVLLGRAYRRDDGPPNLVPAAICATLLFGLGHGFNVDAGSVRFAQLPFIYATVFGAGLAFLRMRARSLPGLIAAHNLANICGVFVNSLP